MTDNEFTQIYNECRWLKNSQIWRIFQETLKDEAQEVMFTKSKDFEDMKTGKMMLYNLDIQKKILERVELGMQKQEALKEFRK